MMSTRISSEVSPLLVGSRSDDTTATNVVLHHRHPHVLPHLSISYDDSHNDDINNIQIATTAGSTPEGGSTTRGTATVFETVLNLMKTCMGTGCLALPFACKNGGIVLYSLGLLLIGAWNAYSVYLLIECLQYVPIIPIITSSSALSSSSSTTTTTRKHHPDEEGRMESTTANTTTNNYQTSSSSSNTKILIEAKTTTSSQIIASQHVVTPTSSSSSPPIIIPPTSSSLPPPPHGTSTLGIVGWYAFGGTKGLYVIDACQIFLLIGVTVSYISAAISFLNDLTNNTNSGRGTNHHHDNNNKSQTNGDGDDNYNYVLLFNAFVTFVVLGSISAWVRDVGALSRASASGLFILLGTFLAIASYGTYVRFVMADSDVKNGKGDYDYDGGYFNYNNNNNITGGGVMSDNASNYDYNSTTTGLLMLSTHDTRNTTSMIHLWPVSLTGISDWFGIAVFGYGIVPITYNFQESMQEPNRIVSASVYAMTGTALLYVVVGVCLYLLFPNIQGDVLHELPNHGWIPLITRLSMIFIVYVTAPLIAVPCAEIIEGKLFGEYNNKEKHQQHDYQHFPSSYKQRRQHAIMMQQRCFVRFSLIGFCTLVAVSLPGFVQVLSLVGCFCVSTVGFCMPPLLHLRLVYLSATQQHQHQQPSNQICQTEYSTSNLQYKWLHPVFFTRSFIRDFVLLVCGINATVLSTIYTLRQIRAGSLE